MIVKVEFGKESLMSKDHDPVLSYFDHISGIDNSSVQGDTLLFASVLLGSSSVEMIFLEDRGHS